MAFKAEPKKVYDIFNRKCYLIPRNQRQYVWDKRNWEELYDDIDIVMERSLPSHFIGSFVLNESERQNGLPYYTIIDGQQRVITLSIILASVLFWLKKEKLTEDYLGTKEYVFATDNRANKVVMLRSDYHLSLESIIKSIDEMPEDQFDKMSVDSFLSCSRYSPNDDPQIVSAFIYFLNRIKDEMDKTASHAEYLRSFRDTVLDASNIIVIAYSEEDSYTIFEILNARGVILEDHELLKNYIMRYIQPEQSRDKAKMVWEEIENELGKSLSHFVMHYAKHVSINYIDELSDYKNIQRTNRGKSTDILLRDLKMKADFYSKIINPSSNCEQDSVEFRVFSFFKRKRQEILRPVILSLMHQNTIGNITNEMYDDALVFMYNFYVCYKIIGEESSNKLTNSVSKYAALIENQFTEDILNDFVNELKSKLPSREQFINSFMNVGWTHHHGYFEGDKNKDRAQTVLEILERYLNGGQCRSEFSIEHILPDSEDKRNGQIGNLLPLEISINKAIGTKSLAEKLEFYKSSNYKTVRSFASRYSEKEFNPDNRSKYLAGLFYDEILKLK